LEYRSFSLRIHNPNPPTDMTTIMLLFHNYNTVCTWKIFGHSPSIQFSNTNTHTIHKQNMTELSCVKVNHFLRTPLTSFHCWQRTISNSLKKIFFHYCTLAIEYIPRGYHMAVFISARISSLSIDNCPRCSLRQLSTNGLIYVYVPI